MNYTDKLKKLKNNLDVLENKSKDDLKEFVTWVIDMSITREEGNRYADELLDIVHKNEIEFWRGLSTEKSEKANKLEDASGYKLDDLTEKLKNGELKIVEGE